MKTIYLDHNATTPVREEVIEEMARCLALGLANPASTHSAGRTAKRLLEEARAGVGKLLGADLNASPSDRVIFTSGGTEANNLAVLGIARAGQARAATANRGTQPQPPRVGHVVASSIEHASIIGPVERLLDEGWRVDSLGATRQGQLQLEQLESLLCEDTRLVTATMANHETGVVQPIAEMAAICNAASVPLHSDAVQMAGKLPIDFRALGVSALSLSAHKFGGPPGVGVLIVRAGTELDSLFFGGEQQSGLRPGTESIALARGLWMALRLAVDELHDNTTRLERLRQRFEQGLHNRLANIEIHGCGARRLPQTVGVAFVGHDAPSLMRTLDRVGVICSVGSACMSGVDEPSPTLLAMGIPMELAKASLRFSFGRSTSTREVDETIERIASVCLGKKGLSTSS